MLVDSAQVALAAVAAVDDIGVLSPDSDAQIALVALAAAIGGNPLWHDPCSHI